jgi:acetyl-CoA acyltransferase
VKAYVAGVGMTGFERPETREWHYWDMVREAGGAALADAGIDYTDVEQVPIGYCFQPSTAGQRAVCELGLTGVPVYNVNNHCATGATALMPARRLVEGGVCDCVLALGFERMRKGALGDDAGAGDFAASPVARHYGVMAARHGFAAAPPTAQIFGAAAREHMEEYGTTEARLAAVAAKNHRHSAHNPYAQFRDVYEVGDILAARVIHHPLTELQCSPTSDGAAAAVVVSERFARRRSLTGLAEITGQVMVTDTEESFASGSCIDVVGQPLPRAAARQAFERVRARRRGRRRDGAARLLLRQRTAHLRSARHVRAGQVGGAGRVRRDDVRRPVGGQPVRRAHLQGPSAGRDRAGADGRAGVAATGRGGRAAGAGGAGGPAHNIGLGGAAVVTVLRAVEDGGTPSG